MSKENVLDQEGIDSMTEHQGAQPSLLRDDKSTLFFF